MSTRWNSRYLTKMLAHEVRELQSLRERGESIVGGALNVDSW